VVSRIVHVIRYALAGCARGLWPSQDALQPIRSPGPAWVSSTESSPAAASSGPPERVMIDSMHLKAHQTAASLLKKADSLGGTNGGLYSKLHAVCDCDSAGQLSFFSHRDK
jgi:hypothetical protein